MNSIPDMILLNTGGPLSLAGRLVGLDHRLFTLINQKWANPFFDHILPFLRQGEIWAPFYLFLLFFSTLNFGRKGWLWSFTLIMTVVISDLISSSVVKHIFFRYRPCCSPDLAGEVRVLAKYCPYNSSSFTSSHACNHFAMAFFIYLTARGTGKAWWLVFAWAALICYAQVYVGVHFPFDVLGGAALGALIGSLLVVFFHKQFGHLSPKYS